jgi:magnesium transporter
MPYLSELIGRPVTDVNGELVGRLEDIVAISHGDLPHPIVVALVVKQAGGSLAIPFSEVAVLIAPAIVLKVDMQHVVPYPGGDQDLFLVRDVLDKQIIDTNGIRVVRVNDLELARVNGHFYVANVDISGLGLMRRLGFAGPLERVAGRFGRKVSSNPIPWDDVELLPGDQPLRLKVPSDKITELHPADLAEILSDMSRAESSKFLESLDIETVADALEEVDPDFEASLVEAMPDEKIADLLEEMAPDEAADLLAELPEDRSQELLSLMDVDEAEDVRKLLAYPEDSAGGIMTTEFIAIPPDLNAGQAITYLRANADEAETIFYIYVVDSEDHLVGVFSLQDLVLAAPETPVDEFMHHRLVSVNVRDSQSEVAQAISKYNLLAIPVVDGERRLQGIVTADDALDKIIPTAWKKRLPRMYRQ